tara:strand:- start:4498 stop:5184 length:687 start_codon:yes stop_codon:yes gene_type:complete
MRIIIFLILVLVIVFGPQLWTRRVFRKHSTSRQDLERTGGEFARHLLDLMSMNHVQVETTPIGDHYDPLTKTVRLMPDNYAKKSLTAMTIAAHEIGHAIQDQSEYPPLKQRTRLIGVAQGAEKLGAGIMMGIPIVAMITQTPSAGLIVLYAGILTMGISTLVHLITLPVEWDASFSRALPILQRGGYLSKQDMQDAHQILTAAAFTYVAASLASLLNLWRWIMLLLRR